MNTSMTVKEILEKKFGDEKSVKVMDRINHAYKNGTRGEIFDMHLNNVIKKEGPDKQHHMPPIIYLNKE